MKLVLDNNIFFSLMNLQSTASYLFSSLRSGFLAPEFIRLELKRHKSECVSKSKLSEHEFEIRQKEVEESIGFVPVSAYKGSLAEATFLLSDPDDADFLALALFVHASIWSNDPHLKQQPLVTVFTTDDMIGFFLTGAL